MISHPIELTHANWVEEDGTPTKILVAPEHIYAAFFMPSAKATAVLAVAGGNIIVKESKEEVFAMRAQGLKDYLPEIKLTADKLADKLITNPNQESKGNE